MAPGQGARTAGGHLRADPAQRAGTERADGRAVGRLRRPSRLHRRRDRRDLHAHPHPHRPGADRRGQGRTPAAGEAARAVVRRVPPDGRRGRRGRGRLPDRVPVARFARRARDPEADRAGCDRPGGRDRRGGRLGARRGVLPAGAVGGQAPSERRGRDRRCAHQPLAHAVATALALDGSTRAEDVTAIETELLHANDIESDDTSCVRITTPRGRVTVAATLCAERPGEPYVLVHGSSGRITFWYKQDRVLVQRSGHGPEEFEYGRTDLLENLVAHLTEGAELLVAPDATGAFMKVVEAIRQAPDPLALPADAWEPLPGRTAGSCPASTDSSRPPPTPSPSTPSSARPGPGRARPRTEPRTTFRATSRTRPRTGPRTRWETR